MGKLLMSLTFVACLWLSLDAQLASPTPAAPAHPSDGARATGVSQLASPTSTPSAHPSDGARVAGASQFTSRVDVVDVYATVTDRAGRPVEGLTKDDFTVFEDEQPQTLSVLAAGDMGLSVALALDRSFSMMGKRLALMKTAARAFFAALQPRDRVMLVGISSRVETIAPLSADRVATQRALEAVDPWGATSLHDAIIEAIGRIEPAEGRRALVVLSDGDDRGSGARAEDAVERARRSDVLIYPVSFGKRRPALFAELASITGGRTIHVKDVKQLQDQLSNVAVELRHQYLLGYTPARPFAKDRPEWRRLRVTVSREGVIVRARPGFWAEGRR